MSTFSFSHQFSQHWITTLPAVKNAIIQELDDITTLLHPDSVLANYEFTVPDLNSHVEQIITEEKTRLAKLQAEQEAQQRLEQERLEQERLAREAVENARLEQIRREEMRLENERLEKIRLEKESLEQLRLAREKQEQFEKERPEGNLPKDIQVEKVEIPVYSEVSPPQSENSAVAMENLESLSHNIQVNNPQPVNNDSNLPHPQPALHPATQNTTAHVANMANPVSSSAVPYEQIKQEIMVTLIQQMEDYIQESMQIMRDDIRPWLESEVEKQLFQRLNQDQK